MGKQEFEAIGLVSDSFFPQKKHRCGAFFLSVLNFLIFSSRPSLPRLHYSAGAICVW
jgi:hypothetical protein